jgi:hypothetical protein
MVGHLSAFAQPKTGAVDPIHPEAPLVVSQCWCGRGETEIDGPARVICQGVQHNHPQSHIQHVATFVLLPLPVLVHALCRPECSRVSRIPQGSTVLPAICTEEVITLGAELEDGTVIRGQNNISHPDGCSEPGGTGKLCRCL